MVQTLAFIFGLFVGSFLNVLVERLRRGENFVFGRSHCDHCRRKLKAWELIPVLSFIWLDGRCASCKKEIPLQYPAVEMLTGLVWLTNWTLPGAGSNLISATLVSLIFSLLVAVAIYDFNFKEIPDKIILAVLGLALFYNLISGDILYSGLAGLVFGAFFSVLFFWSGGKWVGFGDVKLVGVLGFFLGLSKGFLALALAFGIATIFALPLLFLNKKTLKSEIVFGPFLVLATFISYFWGNQILDFYIKLVF